MNDVSTRLRQAREHAGYATAGDAAKAFGWSYPTYAGHENGSRGVRPDALRRYARAFRVNLVWLLDGLGDIQGKSADPPSGFGEASVAPYIAATSSKGKQVENAIRFLVPAGAKHQIYVANSTFLNLGILRGDVIVISNVVRSPAFSVAVVTIADVDTSAARTTLRQQVGDVLVPPPDEPQDDADRQSVGILGHVFAVLRL